MTTLLTCISVIINVPAINLLIIDKILTISNLLIYGWLKSVKYRKYNFQSPIFVLGIIFFVSLLRFMQNFRNIIGLMLLAILALMGFQWYWIQGAINEKNEQFDRQVVDAMNDVALQIEKQEVYFLAEEKLKEQEELNKTLTSTAAPLPKANRKKDKKDSPQKAQLDNFPSVVAEKTVSKKGDNNQKKKPIKNEGLVGLTVQAPITDRPENAPLKVPEKGIKTMRQMMEDRNAYVKEMGGIEKWNERNKDAMETIEVIEKQLATITIQQSARTPNGIEQLSYTILAEQSVPRMVEGKRYTHPDSIKKILNELNGGVIDTMPKMAAKHEPKELNMDASQNSTPKVVKPIAKAAGVKIKPVVSSELKNQETRESQFRKNKVELVKDVFSEYLNGKRSLYDRLDKEMLDTLLRHELIDNGIDIPYEYGVKNNGHLTMASYGLTYDPKLSEKSYKVKLFPNELLRQNQFLEVYFPDKEEYIRQNMYTVFGSSIFIILLIGGIFYSSIDTMLKQKKLSNIKNDFINNMTHEFKTPISTIALATEMLRDKQMQKTPERYLNIISDENKRLASQVEKVLQMALLDKGEIKLNLEEVDMNDVLLSVSENLGMQIEQQGGTLQFDLQAVHSTIKGDELHLSNIVFNLVDNAIKYCKNIPEIIVSSMDTSEGIIIRIKDNGLGMSQDQLIRIFDKFYRVASGDIHDVKGFGLGLSYVKKMVDLHDGQIVVKSTLGEGTEFDITFKHTI